MAVTTYSPKKVTCALGSHIVKGYADDSFITIEPVGDGVAYVSGCDGEIVRSLDPNKMYTIKLVVLQTSATNNWLMNMQKVDQNNGKGTFPVTIKDLLGNDKFTASVAWVTKQAAWTRGKEQNNREWEIVVGVGDFN